MPVSQPLSPSSIDLADLPGNVADAIARLVEFCREQGASTTVSAEAFDTVETGLRNAMNGLGCALIRGWIESRDEGASRIDRDGLS